MPLEKGKSDKAFSHNVRTEMHAGKPQAQSLAIAYAMKRKSKKMAMGGYAEGGEIEKEEMGEYDPTETPAPEANEAALHEDADMIARIMHQRRKMSEGGRVANDTPPEADSERADFDELPADDELEFHETGANEGDELGDKREEMDERDIVSRIMRSRGKRDRMPHPA